MKNKMSRKKFEIDPKLLYRMYWIDRMSTPEIAKLFNISSRTISRALKQYGIRTRTIGEAKLIVDRKHGYPMAGKKHKESTKKKMSLASKGKKKSKKHCQKMAEIFKGPGSGRWRGGQFISRGRYFVWVGPRKYIQRSRIFTEMALGRQLKENEVVHHIDNKPINDDNSNLLICTRSYHMWLHSQINKYMRRQENV